MKLKAHNLIFIIILAILSVHTLLAQDYETVHSDYGYIQHLKWSNDSQSLVFKYDFNTLRGLVTEDPSWYVYHVTQSELNQVREYPFLPELDASDDLDLNMFGTNYLEDILYFMSPSGKYLVYKADSLVVDGRKTFPSLAIANLEAQSVYRIGIDMMPLWDSGTDTFNIIWSDDEDSFIYSGARSGADNLFIYLWGYSTDVTNIQYQIIDYLTLDEIEYDVQDITSISDKNKLLILADRERKEPTIIVYDPQNIDNSLIFNFGTIEGASFVPTNDSNLLFVNGDGLVLFDYQNLEQTILDENINTLWVDYVLFSPDSSYMAVTREIPQETDVPIMDLFVIEVDYP